MACACRDGRECKSCRFRRFGQSLRKYFWTAELTEQLRMAYCGTKKHTSAALDEMERRTGWPRNTFRREAARLGWSVPTRRRWIPSGAEEQYLMERIGSVSLPQIAKKLNRSVSSVQAHAEQLRLSRRPQEGYNMADLQGVFGESQAKVRRWMQRGLFGKVHRHGGKRVTDESVRHFIRWHAAEYDLRRVDQIWFKGMAFGPTGFRVTDRKRGDD